MLGSKHMAWLHIVTMATCQLEVVLVILNLILAKSFNSPRRRMDWEMILSGSAVSRISISPYNVDKDVIWSFLDVSFIWCSWLYHFISPVWEGAHPSPPSSPLKWPTNLTLCDSLSVSHYRICLPEYKWQKHLQIFSLLGMSLIHLPFRGVPSTLTFQGCHLYTYLSGVSLIQLPFRGVTYTLTFQGCHLYTYLSGVSLIHLPFRSVTYTLTFQGFHLYTYLSGVSLIHLPFRGVTYTLAFQGCHLYNYLSGVSLMYLPFRGVTYTPTNVWILLECKSHWPKWITGWSHKWSVWPHTDLPSTAHDNLWFYERHVWSKEEELDIYWNFFKLMYLLKIHPGTRAGREYGINEKIAQDMLGLQSNAFILCLAAWLSPLLRIG